MVDRGGAIAWYADGIVTLLDAAGFKAIRQWIDRDAAFALTLGQV